MVRVWHIPDHLENAGLGWFMAVNGMIKKM